MMMVMRLYQWSRRAYLRGIPLLPTILCRLNRHLFACELSYRAELHPTVFFPHKALGVVIGDDVECGPRVHMLQNVTLGGRNGERGPRIEEGVLLGAGCCVLGDVRIGKDAKIGANAVVLSDVPAGAVAVGVPARVRG